MAAALRSGIRSQWEGLKVCSPRLAARLAGTSAGFDTWNGAGVCMRGVVYHPHATLHTGGTRHIQARSLQINRFLSSNSNSNSINSTVSHNSNRIVLAGARMASTQAKSRTKAKATSTSVDSSNSGTTSIANGGISPSRVSPASESNEVFSNSDSSGNSDRSESSTPRTETEPLIAESTSGASTNTNNEVVQKTSLLHRILERLTHNISEHPKYTFRWWVDFTTLMTVFALAGSSCTRVSGYVLHNVAGMEGSFWHGPWTYTLAHFLFTFPVYSVILVAIGTLFGHGPYARMVAWRMWGRILTPLLRLFKRQS